MVDPSGIGMHKQGAGRGVAVNADMNMREVDPSRTDLHKQKGRGCECQCEREKDQTGIDMHKQGALQTGRVM